jgi:hypothetical protein
MNFSLRSYLLPVASAGAAVLPSGAIVAGSFLALLLFTAPGWTQFRRPSMGMTPMAHTPVAVGQSTRGFPIFPTGGIGAFTPTMHNVFMTTPGSIDRAITSNRPPIFGANGTVIPGTPGFVTSGLRPMSPAHFVSDISNPIFSTSPVAHMFHRYDRDREFPTFGNGAFTPTARNFFTPTPGSVDRAIVSNQPPVFGANGTIIPGTPGFVASGLRPVSPANFVSNISNPISNPIFSSSPFAHTFRHYDRELWRSAAWSNSYTPSGSSGYASPSSGYGNSSSGSASGYDLGSGYQASAPYAGAANNMSNQIAAYGNSSTAQSKPSEMLKAFGIPVEFGQVQWPLALRTMPPDTRRDLLDKLEAQMRIAASQALNGNASQMLLRETKNTIDSAKWWLRGRRSNIAESTYQDGDAFLRQLEDALRRMES